MKNFKRIYLEITNVCNLSCSFCAKNRRPPSFLKREEFLNALTKLQGHTKHLYFHVLGEPLLHPDLAEFIQLADQMGFRVNLTTNGSLLKPEIFPQILRDGLRQINISLHSWRDNNPLGQREDFDQYLKNIALFIEEARITRPQLYISLRLWNLKETGSPINDNQYLLEKLIALLALDTDLSPKDLANGHRITLAKNLFLNSEQEFIWPNLKNENYGETGYCYGLKDQIAILVDGTVVPCCLDSEGIINLGNIHHTSLAEIINSPRALAISQGFAKRKAVEELCQKCGFKKRF